MGVQMIRAFFATTLHLRTSILLLLFLSPTMAPSSTSRAPRKTKSKSSAQRVKSPKKNKPTQDQKVMRAARNKRYYDKKKLYETLV